MTRYTVSHRQPIENNTYIEGLGDLSATDDVTWVITYDTHSDTLDINATVDVTARGGHIERYILFKAVFPQWLTLPPMFKTLLAALKLHAMQEGFET